jgi:hypothetical protein
MSSISFNDNREDFINLLNQLSDERLKILFGDSENLKHWLNIKDHKVSI